MQVSISLYLTQISLPVSRAATVLRRNANPSLDKSWNFTRDVLQHARSSSMGKHIPFEPQAITIDIAKFPDNRIRVFYYWQPITNLWLPFQNSDFQILALLSLGNMIRFFNGGLNLKIFTIGFICIVIVRRFPRGDRCFDLHQQGGTKERQIEVQKNS